MGKSKIEWTEATWNPVTGCTKISAGCANCYAKTMAIRLRHMGHPLYTNGFDVTVQPDHVFDKPYSWRKARRVFVCSMGDLFHKDVPYHAIRKAFDVMINTSRHTYYLLTKRPDRMAQAYWDIVKAEAYDHIWYGTTVENHDAMIQRLPALGEISSPNLFVSCEPLLGPVALNGWTNLLSWIIVGGENGGRGSRPMHPSWATDLRNQAIDELIPFFFKQWGSWRPKRSGEAFNATRNGANRFVSYSGKMSIIQKTEFDAPMVRGSKKSNGCLLRGQEWKQLP